MSRRANLTSEWTQTDTRAARCYDIQRDMLGEDVEEWETYPLEYLDAERSALEDAASLRQQRYFEREDGRLAERLSNQRAVVAKRLSSQGAVTYCPSDENIRPIYRSNVERRLQPPQPTTRRRMSLDRQPQRAGQSRIPRARSASETSQVSRPESRLQQSVVHRNHRPLRSPNAMHVHFECTPDVSEEHVGDEESDDVFLVNDSPTTPQTWRDRTPALKCLALRTQSEQMHRVARETKQRTTGTAVSSRVVEDRNTSNNRSISAKHHTNGIVSTGRSNASQKHNVFAAPYSYDHLVISANGEQKTPDSGYLSPQESGCSPNEGIPSTPARNQRTRSMSAESGVRASGLPRRTASSTIQRQGYRSQVAPERSSGNNGHVREKYLSGVTTPSGGRATSSSLRPRSAMDPVKEVHGHRPTRSDWSPRCNVRSASEPPLGGCDGGGAEYVKDSMQPIDVRLSESFFENEQDAAGHWLSTGEGLLSPSELGLWPFSEGNTSPSSHPSNEKHPDEPSSASDGSGRNNDYISSLMQRELDRSCMPAEPKKYFDLAPTYKKWLYDYSRTDAPSGATSVRRREVIERPVKSPSRLPHRIATYRRMAAQSEKTAVH